MRTHTIRIEMAVLYCDTRIATAGRNIHEGVGRFGAACKSFSDFGCGGRIVTNVSPDLGAHPKGCPFRLNPNILPIKKSKGVPQRPPRHDWAAFNLI